MINQSIRLLLACVALFIGNLNAQIPNNYYQSAKGKKGAELKTALHVIICNDTSNYLRYGSGVGYTWQGFYYADRDIQTDKVLDMYSNIERFFPNPNPNFVSFGNDLHIEHSFPKSWFRGMTTAPYKDLYHLYPADGSTNLSKSNLPLGKVVGTPTFDNGLSKVGNGNYTGYTGKVFEPADEYKGDFARSYFYLVTAFENYSAIWNSPMIDNNTYPVFNDWALEVLLNWHRNDPVSIKELQRIEVVFSFQNNRNPFIDYPELVEYIWGDSINFEWQGFVSKIENNSNDIKIEIIKDSLIVKSKKNDMIEVDIYSLSGKKIRNHKDNQVVSVPINGLANGVYLYQIKTQGILKSGKFFVNHN